MNPDCRHLVEKAGITYPIVGYYDTPDPSVFEPRVRPKEGRWACVFMFFNRWLKGDSLHLTANNFGCGGAGSHIFGVQTRSREDYIDFLVGEEGLKATGELMGRWIDQKPTYRPENDHIIIGPLKAEQHQNLRTATFFINPDQLSIMVTAAHYFHDGAPSPLITAPFAAGCGLMGPAFEDLNRPAAIVGGTDIAMRKYLPPEIFAFTVTQPMFEQLCAIDENSFLERRFWQELQKKRSAAG